MGLPTVNRPHSPPLLFEPHWPGLNRPDAQSPTVTKRMVMANAHPIGTDRQPFSGLSELLDDPSHRLRRLNPMVSQNAVESFR